MEATQARALIRSLMAAHGLEEWGFKFTRSFSQAGSCDYTKRELRLSLPTVEVSDEAAVRDTVLHEIAHALVGPSSNAHGAVWEARYRALGGTGGATMEATPAMVARERAVAKYTATCTHCGETYHAHRRLKNFDKRMCGSLICQVRNRLPELRRHLVWIERA